MGPVDVSRLAEMREFRRAGAGAGGQGKEQNVAMRLLVCAASCTQALTAQELHCAKKQNRGKRNERG